MKKVFSLLSALFLVLLLASSVRAEEVEPSVSVRSQLRNMRQEKMSEVARQVEVFLSEKEDGEGIGEKVREVAREQRQSQSRIAQKLAKMEQRKVWLKKMLGYNEQMVLSLQEEIMANNTRIEELQELQEESLDPVEKAELEEMIAVLLEQNVSLRDTLEEEMENKGLWGWFRGLWKSN